MRYIKKDKNGKVKAVSSIKFTEDYELATEDYDVGFDGKIYSVTEMQSEPYIQRKSEFEKLKTLASIRSQREAECFQVINRGALWYDKLTDEQKEELSSWYEEWLNAPETGIIPSKPTWIDIVTKRRPS